MAILQEYFTHDQANIQLESVEDPGTKLKNMLMRGTFLQAEVKNHNGRNYPHHEISKAVGNITEKIRTLGPVGGELNHPDGLEINPERVSHLIKEMWMEGNNGMGKLVIVPTILGNTVRTLLESGMKLGVSSRGTGNVGADGRVFGFEIVTVDIVSQPSAPNAYPTTIYEKLYREGKTNLEVMKLAEAINHDKTAQKYLTKAVTSWFNEALKWRN